MGDEILKMLAECPVTDHPIAYCNVSGSPSIRACPGCAELLYHTAACKHMDCPRCNASFCWLCLKLHEEHDGTTYDWSVSVPCPIAPRQTRTTLPVLEE